MGVYNYYPKNSTAGQTFGIATYTPSVQKMMFIVAHGKGECGDGSLAVLQNLSKWGDSWNGGWKDLKLAADKYGIVLVWVNTSSTSFFGQGELTFALDWGLKKFPTIPEAKTWGLGHSLGGRGWMLYFYTELTLAKRMAGVIISAAGPYPTSDQFQNIVDSNAKVWGVTATNDTESGTDPIYTRKIYDSVKAINPGARVIVSEFPTGTWSASTAHNAVLTKLTRDPIEVTASITRGIVAGLPIKMNLYEWCLSNPRGSIYQDPTLFYTGPKYPNVTIKDVNHDYERKICEINWQDGQQQTIVKAATGDRIVNVFQRKDSNGNELVDVKFATAPTLPFGPYRK